MRGRGRRVGGYLLGGRGMLLEGDGFAEKWAVRGAVRCFLHALHWVLVRIRKDCCIAERRL